MEIMGLKQNYLLNTGQKASRSMFIGTTGHDDKKNGQSRFK